MAKSFEQEKDERPIVCGTDFSETAVEAVDIAAAIARKLETKLVLVHVDELRGMAALDPKLFEVTLSQKQAELAGEAERLRKAGTAIEEKLLTGSAFEELVETAVKFKAGLIVIGAIGCGLARRLLVGSVAERTAETSPVPTLVVRPKSKLSSWIRGEHSLKILVGYDFSAAADTALRWVNQIQKIGACEIEVLHADWPPEEAHRLKYEGALPLTENPQELQKVLERDLAERVAKFLSADKLTMTVQPGWGRTEAYLYEMAARHDIDLVVVGTHGRRGLDRLRFGSVSRDVLRHATVSVVIVPPFDETALRT